MAEDDGNKYPGNEIIKSNGAHAVGFYPSRTSDVHWSNTAKGQGACGGSKLEGDARTLGHIKYNIRHNTITARNGESEIGMFSFCNVAVYWRNAGQGQGIFHNIYNNNISADRYTKVGLENFGNIKFHCKITCTKDNGKSAGGSSNAKGQGGGGGTKPKVDDHNICGNDIKGDGDTKAFRNFSNIEYDLMTTNREDDGSTGQANISDNIITAKNDAQYVGMFDFLNVYVWSNGRRGNKSFLQTDGISYNIRNNKISAYKSREVGFQNFCNIRHNCKTTSSIPWMLGLVGFGYLFQNFFVPVWL